MDAAAWLVRWFRRHGAAPEPKANYFEAGLIDSLAVVQLVADIEETFLIRFVDSHYQEERFSTLGGLAEIITELSAAREAR